MSFVDRLFRRDDHSGDGEIAVADCKHEELAPHWADAADMGHEERATHYVCPRCGASLEPAEAQALKRARVDRLRQSV